MTRSVIALAATCLLGACAGQPAQATPPPDPQEAREPRHGHAETHDHRHHGSHHRFEDADEWARQFDDPARDAWQRPDAVVEWIGLRPDMTVTDLGAGTGYFAVRLARAVPQGTLLANDIEPDMIRYLRERAAREDLTNLVAVHGQPDDPALDRAVDVAFLCDVYHHIEDRKRFFRAVADRLGPDGRLVIVDFKKDAPEDAPGPPRPMRVAADRIVEELAPLGFRETRREVDLLPYQYVLELSLER